MPAMPAMARRVIWCAKVALTLAALFYLFRHVPFAEVAGALGRIDPLLATLAMLLVVALRFLAALRTKPLADAQGLSLSVGQLCEVSFVTSLYGLLLPGAIAGGAVRWYKLARADRALAAALGVIVLDRFLDSFGVVALGWALWALDGQPGASATVGGLLFGGFIAGVLVYGAASTWNEVPSWLERAGVLGIYTRRGFERLARFGRLPGRVHLRILTLGLCKDCAGTLAYWCFASGLGLDLSLATVGWVRAATIFVTLLPISFAGLGVREWTCVALLAPYAVGKADAVAFSLLILAGHLLVCAIGGVLELRSQLLVERPRLEAE